MHLELSTKPFPEPRAAYVHVPFCVHRCGYCDFTVVAGKDRLIPAYLDALEIELEGLERPRPRVNRPRSTALRRHQRD